MRDRVDHWLLLAMVLVEALRGVGDLRVHIRWMREQAAKAQSEGNPAAAASWRRRAQEWAVFAGVCAVAGVPVLYYGIHAAVS